MMVVCFDPKALDKFWNSSKLAKRNAKVRKRCMEEIRKVARGYGFEIAADYEAEYGSVNPYIRLSTIHGDAIHKAHKFRKEEDDEIRKMDAEVWRVYSEAEAKARKA